MIEAGYLTMFGVINTVFQGQDSDAFLFGIIALGVIIMQYFTLLLILRNDYLMLDLVSYYYADLRIKTEKLLKTKPHAFWNYENHKFNNTELKMNKLTSLQFKLSSLIRYGIPFICSLLVGIFYYFQFKDAIKHVFSSWNTCVSSGIFWLIFILLTLILFIFMIKYDIILSLFLILFLLYLLLALQHVLICEFLMFRE